MMHGQKNIKLGLLGFHHPENIQGGKYENYSGTHFCYFYPQKHTFVFICWLKLQKLNYSTWNGKYKHLNTI